MGVWGAKGSGLVLERLFERKAGAPLECLVGLFDPVDWMPVEAHRPKDATEGDGAVVASALQLLCELRIDRCLIRRLQIDLPQGVPGLIIAQARFALVDRVPVSGALGFSF